MQAAALLRNGVWLQGRGRGQRHEEGAGRRCSIWAFQMHVPPYAPEVILFMHMQNKILIETLLKDPP